MSKFLEDYEARRKKRMEDFRNRSQEGSSFTSADDFLERRRESRQQDKWSAYDQKVKKDLEDGKIDSPSIGKRPTETSLTDKYSKKEEDDGGSILGALSRFYESKKEDMPDSPMDFVRGAVETATMPFQFVKGIFDADDKPDEKWEGRNLGEKLGSSFRAGTYDVTESLSGGMKWYGDKVGSDFWKKAGTGLQNFSEDSREGFEAPHEEFSAKRLADPDFYTGQVFRQAPNLAVSLFSGLGAYNVLNKANKMRGISKTIVNSIAAGGVSNALDSSMEAGDTYNQAEKMGLDPVKASEEVWGKNMLLNSGLEAGQFALGLTPLGKVTNKIGKFGEVGLKATGGAGIEAFQEGMQSKIQNEALGEEFSWTDPSTVESMVIGALMGGTMTGALALQSDDAGMVTRPPSVDPLAEQDATEIITAVTESAKTKMNTEQRERFEKAREVAEKNGMVGQEAEDYAWEDHTQQFGDDLVKVATKEFVDNKKVEQETKRAQVKTPQVEHAEKFIEGEEVLMGDKPFKVKTIGENGAMELEDADGKTFTPNVFSVQKKESNPLQPEVVQEPVVEPQAETQVLAPEPQPEVLEAAQQEEQDIDEPTMEEFDVDEFNIGDTVMYNGKQAKVIDNSDASMVELEVTNSFGGKATLKAGRQAVERSSQPQAQPKPEETPSPQEQPKTVDEKMAEQLQQDPRFIEAKKKYQEGKKAKQEQSQPPVEEKKMSWEEQLEERRKNDVKRMKPVKDEDVLRTAVDRLVSSASERSIIRNLVDEGNIKEARNTFKKIANNGGFGHGDISMLTYQSKPKITTADGRELTPTLNKLFDLWVRDYKAAKKSEPKNETMTAAQEETKAEPEKKETQKERLHRQNKERAVEAAKQKDEDYIRRSRWIYTNPDFLQAVADEVGLDLKPFGSAEEVADGIMYAGSREDVMRLSDEIVGEVIKAMKSNGQPESKPEEAPSDSDFEKGKAEFERTRKAKGINKKVKYTKEMHEHNKKFRESSRKSDIERGETYLSGDTIEFSHPSTGVTTEGTVNAHAGWSDGEPSNYIGVELEDGTTIPPFPVKNILSHNGNPVINEATVTSKEKKPEQPKKPKKERRLQEAQETWERQGQQNKDLKKYETLRDGLLDYMNNNGKKVEYHDDSYQEVFSAIQLFNARKIDELIEEHGAAMLFNAENNPHYSQPFEHFTGVNLPPQATTKAEKEKVKNLLTQRSQNTPSFDEGDLVTFEQSGRKGRIKAKIEGVVPEEYRTNKKGEVEYNIRPIDKVMSAATIKLESDLKAYDSKDVENETFEQERQEEAPDGDVFKFVEFEAEGQDFFGVRFLSGNETRKFSILKYFQDEGLQQGDYLLIDGKKRDSLESVEGFPKGLIYFLPNNLKTAPAVEEIKKKLAQTVKPKEEKKAEPKEEKKEGVFSFKKDTTKAGQERYIVQLEEDLRVIFNIGNRNNVVHPSFMGKIHNTQVDIKEKVDGTWKNKWGSDVKTLMGIDIKDVIEPKELEKALKGEPFKAETVDMREVESKTEDESTGLKVGDRVKFGGRNPRYSVIKDIKGKIAHLEKGLRMPLKNLEKSEAVIDVKEGDRIRYEDKKGKMLSGTVLSLDMRENTPVAKVDVEQESKVGGVPIGRKEIIPVARILKVLPKEGAETVESKIEETAKPEPKKEETLSEWEAYKKKNGLGQIFENPENMKVEDLLNLMDSWSDATFSGYDEKLRKAYEKYAQKVYKKVDKIFQARELTDEEMKSPVHELLKPEKKETKAPPSLMEEVNRPETKEEEEFWADFDEELDKKESTKKEEKSFTHLDNSVPVNKYDKAREQLDWLKKQSEAARKRLEKNKNRMNSLPMDMLVDYAIVGAEKIASKTIDFAEFSEEMIKEFGGSIKLYMRAIHAQSEQILDSTPEEIDEMLRLADKDYKEDVTIEAKDFPKEVQGEFDEALKNHIQYLKDSMGKGVEQGGVIKDDNGEISGRYGRISRNPQWYQDFYSQYKKKPNQKELEILAYDHLLNGFHDEFGTISDWESDMVDRMEDDVDQLSELYAADQSPSTKKSLDEARKEMVEVRKAEKIVFNNMQAKLKELKEGVEKDVSNTRNSGTVSSGETTAAVQGTKTEEGAEAVSKESRSRTNGKPESNGNGRPDEGSDRERVPSERPRSDEAVPNEPGTPDGRPLPVNHEITGDIYEPNAKKRFQNNIEALKVVKVLEEEKRQATETERDALAKYQGWGGLPNYFDKSKPEHEEMMKHLNDELFTEEDYNDMRESITTSFFTNHSIASQMYRILESAGFEGGKILESSVGTGMFLGSLPSDMKQKTRFTTTEKTKVSHLITKHLYPKNNNHYHSKFEAKSLPENTFDVVIGNVPFGQFGVSDPTYDKRKMKWATKTIHNYFLVRNMDLLREGGVGMLITSTGSLDNPNAEVRNYLMEQADMIEAIRLPENAFKDAGTSVATDIIFFRKKTKGSKTKPGNILVSQPVKDTHRGYMNHYFMENPSHIIGEMYVKRDQYGTMKPHFKKLDTFEKDLSKVMTAISKKFKGKFVPNEEESTDIIRLDNAIQEAWAQDEKGIYEGAVHEKNGKLVQFTYDKWVPFEVKADQQEKVKKAIGIRDTLNALMKGERDKNKPTQSLKPLRDKLNVLYDAFVKKHGNMNKKGVLTPLEKDVRTASMLRSLEKSVGKGKWEKIDLFSKRMSFPDVNVDVDGDLKEAVTLSVYHKGSLDLDFIAELMGDSKEDTIAQLEKDNMIFFDPQQGGYVTDDEYLSGNIYEKLQFVQGKDEYSSNEEALLNVLPDQLTSEQVIEGIKFGQMWIPTDVYEGFLKKALDIKQPIVKFDSATASWTITSNANWGAYDSHKNTETFGMKDGILHSKWTGNKIVETMMNQKSLKASIKKERLSRTQKAEVEQERLTNVLRRKGEQLVSEFQAYITGDENVKKRLTDLYNKKFNGYVLREYDGERYYGTNENPKPIPGLNPKYKLYKHQKDTTIRTLQSQNTLYAHVVGAGKSLEMYTAIMEGRRLGIINKPAMIVPTFMLEQHKREFLDAFPGAKIRVVSTGKSADDIAGTNVSKNKAWSNEKYESEVEKNRKLRYQSLSDITYGDYDAVIFTYTSWERLPVSPEYEEQFLRGQIDVLRGALEEHEGTTAKEIENAIQRLEKRLTDNINRDIKDVAIPFEELGIDAIFVDEAHNFKNLLYHSKMGNIAGLSNSSANRSLDMFIKTSYLNQTGGKTVFATGTPIANSVAEMYTMLRYLAPDKLQNMDMEHFDGWASQFGVTINSVELNTSGKFVEKTRFAQFTNVPELMNIFKSVADVKMANDLPYLKRPQVERRTVTTPMSDNQKTYLELMIKRAENVSGGVEPFKDNLLKLTGEGKKLALDYRIVDGMAANEKESKLNRIAEEVYTEYVETEKGNVGIDGTTFDNGTQIVFMDLGVPKSQDNKKEDSEEDEDAGSSSMYQNLKDRLIELGVKEKHIAFVHDYSKPAQKKKLSDMFNAGDVRVLIGSTGKMGVGMNLQKRLTHLHHADPTWRPADIEQREGRIIRQGNQNPNVKISTYVTESSFDALMWNTLESKAKFIAQVMSGGNQVRTMDEISELVMSYTEIKASATNNEAMKKLLTTEKEMRILKDLEGEHLKEQAKFQYDLNNLPKKIEKQEGQLASILEAEANVVSVVGEDFKMTIGKKEFTDRKEARQEFVKLIHEIKDEKQSKDFDNRIATLGNMEIRVEGEQTSGLMGTSKFRKRVYLSYKPENGIRVEFHSISIENAINNEGQALFSQFATKIKWLLDKGYSEKMQTDIKRSKEALAEAKTKGNAPFSRKPELDKMVNEVADLREEARQYELTNSFDTVYQYKNGNYVITSVDYRGIESKNKKKQSEGKEDFLIEITIEEVIDIKRGVEYEDEHGQKHQVDVFVTEGMGETMLDTEFIRESTRMDDEGITQRTFDARMMEIDRVKEEMKRQEEESKKNESKAKPKNSVIMDTYVQAVQEQSQSDFTEEEAPTTDQTITRSDIVKHISKEFQVPIGQGRYRQKVEGLYKGQPNIIRTKKFADFVVLTHELGHVLDRKYQLSDNVDVQQELLNLAETNLQIPDGMDDRTKMREGVAEFMRLLNFNHQEALDKAPDFYQHFKQVMKDENLTEAVEQLGDMLDTWTGQSPRDRILGVMDDRKKSKSIDGEDLYRKLYDELSGIDKGVKKITKEKLDGKKDPYKIARNTIGTGGKIKSFLEHGVEDANGNKVFPSLKEILEPVQDTKILNAYLLAKHGLTLLEEGKYLTPISERDAKATIRTTPKEYQDVAEQLYEYQAHLLEMLVDGGMLKESQMNDMQEKYPYYVPFYRVMEESGERDNKKGDFNDRSKKFANQSSAIRGMKESGSTRNIINPLENIVKNTFMYINMAERNKVGVALADLVDNTNGSAEVMEKVDGKMKVESFSLLEIEKTLKDAGVDVENINLEEMGKVFRPIFTPSARENILVVWKEGQQLQYKVRDKALYDSLLNLDTAPLTLFAKLLGVPNNILRAGITLSPTFIPKSPLRAIPTMFMQSDSYTKPKDFMQLPFDLMKGYMDVFKKNETYRQWLSSGGAQSTLLSIENDYLLESKNRIMMNQSTRNKLKHAMVDTVKLKPLRALTEFMDEGVRLTEYKKALEKTGGDRTEAAFRSREVDLDLGRFGSHTKGVNRISLFFNVALQGPDRTFREFKKHPVRTVTRGALFLTIPTLLLMMQNWDDEDYWELEQWERDLFWNIPKGNGEFIRIPIPFEYGLIFKTIPERIVTSMVRDDRKGFEEIFKTISGTMVPSVLPTAFVPFLEALTNTDFRFWRDIDGMGDLYKEPKDRYSDHTSEFAKMIGAKGNVSPKRVDQFIKSATGTLGGIGTSLYDSLTGSKKRAIGETPSSDRGAFERTFISSSKDGNTESTGKFYPELDKVERDHKRNGEKGKPSDKVKMMREAADIMKNMRKMRTEIRTDKSLTAKQKGEAIEKINIAITDISRVTLGKEMRDREATMESVDMSYRYAEYLKQQKKKEQ